MTSNNAFTFLFKEQAICGEEVREICNQHGKDWKLRYLNWTGNRRKDTVSDVFRRLLYGP